jgi:hypothetical protein
MSTNVDAVHEVKIENVPNARVVPVRDGMPGLDAVLIRASREECGPPRLEKLSDRVDRFWTTPGLAVTEMQVTRRGTAGKSICWE